MFLIVVLAMSLQQTYELPSQFWVTMRGFQLDKSGVDETHIDFYSSRKAIGVSQFRQGKWTKKEYTTSYFPTAIAPLYPNTLYVAGTFPNGMGIVEKWVISGPGGPGGNGINLLSPACRSVPIVASAERTAERSFYQVVSCRPAA